MTTEEREKPSVLNASRRKRIAAGSGVKVEDVNRLVKQLEMMQGLFKQMNGKGVRGRKRISIPGIGSFEDLMRKGGIQGGPDGFPF